MRGSAAQPEEVAAAEQAVKSAIAALAGSEAKLAQVQSGGKRGELATARAAVSGAKSQLDLKRNGPSPSEVGVAQARLRQAETQLAQAKLALSNAELRALYSRTIIALGARASEYVGFGGAVVTLADLSTLRTETGDLDEYATKKAVAGKEVTVSINSWPDKEVKVVVRSIAQWDDEC